MKLINAIVKSMEWSIKTKKSQLLRARHKANRTKISKRCSGHKTTKRKRPKAQVSKNELKATDYFSLETESSNQLNNCKKSLNLGLVLTKLETLRQILKEILNDLNDLIIFHNETFSNICEKCREFAYNDDRNQLETFNIIDTLMKTLGVDIMVGHYSINLRRNNDKTIGNAQKEATTQILLKENKTDSDESTESSDEFTSNCPEISPKFIGATLKKPSSLCSLVFNGRETNTHNFRCELILFLSMLRDIICKVCDISKQHSEQNRINGPTTKRQILKLKEEYFVILNYVTELIEGPRSPLKNYRIRRSYTRIMVKLKINILVSKKQIFEILYEMCQLKKNMKRYHDILEWQNSDSPSDLPSISSQVLIKIEDVCSKLKYSHSVLHNSKKTKDYDVHQTQQKHPNSDYSNPEIIKEREVISLDGSKNKKEKRIDHKITGKSDSNKAPQTSCTPHIHKIRNVSQIDQPTPQRLNLKPGKPETNLHKNNSTDVEHKLLQKIYQLLEDYLEKTKEMDLEKIKDFIERETLNYSKELRKMYSLDNLTDFSSMNNNLKRPNVFTQNPKLEKSTSPPDHVTNDSIEHIYKQSQTASTTDDEKQRTKNGCVPLSNFKVKNHNQLSQKSKNLKTEKNSNYEEREQMSTLSNFIYDSKRKDTILKLVNEKINDVSKYASHQLNSVNHNYCNFHNFNEERKMLGKTDKLRNCHANDDREKICRTRNKELLEELERLEIIAYCLQNKSDENEVRLTKQMDESVENSIGLKTDFLLDSQHERHNKSKIKDEEFKKNKRKELKSTQAFSEDWENTAKTSDPISPNQNKRATFEVKDFETLEETPAHNNTKSEVKKDAFCYGRHSENLNMPPIQHAQPLLQNDARSDQINKEHLLNAKMHGSSYDKTKDKSCDKLKDKNKDKLMASFKKTPTVDIETQNLLTQVTLHEEPADRVKYRSKSENSIKLFTGCTKFPNQRCVGDFSDNKNTAEDKNSVLKVRLLRKIQNNSPQKTEKKDQMVQIDLIKCLSQKYLDVKKITQNRKEKSKKHRRKKLRTKFSKKSIVGSVQNDQLPFHLEAPQNFSQESKKLEIPSYKNYLSKCETNYPSNIVGNWTTSNVFNSSRLHTIFDSASATNSLSLPKQSNILCDRHPKFNLDTSKSKDKSALSPHTEMYNTDLNINYTSNKGIKICTDKTIMKEECSPNEEIQDQTSKFDEQFSKTNNFLTKSEEFFNSRQNIIPVGNLHTNESRFKVPSTDGAKCPNFDDQNYEFELRKATNKTILKEPKNFSKNKNKTQSDEITTLFAFEKLINMKNKQNNYQKRNDGNEIDLFSTCSEMSLRNNCQAENICKSQKHNSAKMRQNFENNFKSQPEITASNIEYTQAKLDLMFRKNLTTDTLSDSQSFTLPHTEKKVMPPTTKPLTYNSSNGSEPLTGFYMDCLINTNANEQYHRNGTDLMDFYSSKLKTFIKKEKDLTDTCSVKIHEQKSGSDKKVPRKIQKAALKSYKHKPSERNSKLKTSLKSKRSRLNIKKSCTDLNQTVNLIASHIETRTEPLFPKEQLTKCLRNKLRAEEFNQEIITQFIEYHNSYQRIPLSAEAIDTEVMKITPSLTGSEENLLKTISKEKKRNKTHSDKRNDMTLHAHQIPMQLYKYNGLPLTNMKGEPLKDAYGQVLVTFDKSGRPISDNKENIIFDSKNRPNTSHKFNPYTRPKDNPFKVQLTNEQGEPLILYNEVGHPVTDDNGYSLFDINGDPLIRFDSCGRPISDCKGNPLHTPSNREIKKSWRKHRKFSKDSDQWLSSTPSDSLLSCCNSFMTKKCQSDYNIHVNANDSLALSSLRAVDSFLSNQSTNEFALESDQLDLISQVLTTGYSIGSKSTTASERSTKVTDKFTLSSDGLRQSLLNEKCHENRNIHTLSDLITGSAQLANYGKRTAENRTEKVSNYEKVFNKDEYSNTNNNTEINTIPKPKLDHKSHRNNKISTNLHECISNSIRFKRNLRSQLQKEESNYFHENGHISNIPEIKLCGEKAETYHLEDCIHRSHRNLKKEDNPAVLNVSCVESIEIMNEIFKSIFLDTFDQSHDEGIISEVSCTSEPTGFSQLSEVPDRSLTEYSENMMKVFGASCNSEDDYDIFEGLVFDKYRDDS